jgi:type I restriction enzyme, S subunit
LSPDAHLIAYFVRWISDEILKASYGGAQPNISPQKLAAFELEWPATKNGRSEVVGKLQAAFAWIDRLSSEATSARKLIDHLDQAILARAFRGELVPQDPNDEPASVLLERIGAERTAGSSQKA